MYSNEIRELTKIEIEQKLMEYYQELFNLRFQMVAGQLKDYNRIRIVKRDVARLKTIAQEKV
ncbi:MAG: 50S ribosomal protein L29 [Anaerolineaceae bacterium 4572_78]|nr:MAG: 50S ribosomal protein L29 [Anaerolineaceae bacterium 4572_78]